MAWPPWSQREVECNRLALTLVASQFQRQSIELRTEISNIVNAIAQGGLKSRKALAERLEYAELQLAAEDNGDENSLALHKPPLKEFCSRFLATISARFEDSARETRATLRNFAGAPIKIAPKNNSRVFVVSCALSRATCPLFYAERSLNEIQCRAGSTSASPLVPVLGLLTGYSF